MPFNLGTVNPAVQNVYAPGVMQTTPTSSQAIANQAYMARLLRGNQPSSTSPASGMNSQQMAAALAAVGGGLKNWWGNQGSASSLMGLGSGSVLPNGNYYNPQSPTVFSLGDTGNAGGVGPNTFGFSS